MATDQEKRQWRTGMWMVLVILVFVAVCSFGAGFSTAWTVWH